MTAIRSAFILTAACALALSAGHAAAAEAELGVTANSAYVWRGQVLNDEAVLQPSLTVSTDYGLSFNVWGNVDLTDNLGDDRKNEFNELDPTITYTLPIEAASIDIGYVEYLFPHQTLEVEGAAEGETTTESYPGTREVFVSAGLDVLLSPTLAVYYDFDEAEGVYGVASISHSMDLVDKLSAEIALSVGYANEDYNAYYFGVEENDFNDGNAKLTLTYAVLENLSLSGYVLYTKLLSSDIEEAADANEAYFNDGDVVSGGATVAYTF